MAKRIPSKPTQATDADDTLIDIAEVTHSANDFYHKYQKLITGGVVALVLLVGGYFAFTQLYKGPRNEKAQDLLRTAEQRWLQDSFQLALNSPGGGNPGLLKIISDYGGTPAGNLAKYYAGIAYLKMGQFDQSIKYLEDFSAGDELFKITAAGALGDAYSEKNDFPKALSYYEKAASAGDNSIMTPYYLKKLGMLLEKQKKPAEALEKYKMIKEKYPTSPDGMDADLYISKLEASAK